jgi:type IV pilus assembly protein PilV
MDVHYAMSHRTVTRLKKPQGFTLLEVLISIVVIAFGLLGIAGLQAFALQNNQSAGQRMTTTMLANDIIERVWSSSADMRINYSTDRIADYRTINTSCLSPSGCAPIELVANDLAEWQASLDSIKSPASGLPEGQGIICKDGSPDDGVSANAPECDMSATAPFVVKIWWRDDRSAAANAAMPLQRFTWSFNP